ncbi:MAG: amidohydrolase [SAR202 cluster bacterium]|nr:amidohydrolase [SAR202 cluster bacterium]
MTSTKYRVVSADSHMDLAYLPRDLWTSRFPREMRDRAPRIMETEKGTQWVAGSMILGPAGRRRFRDKSDQLSIGHRLEETEKANPGDSRLRLQDLEKDGVDAEVMYGILGMGLKVKEPTLRGQIYRAYNDYISEFCGAAPGRFFALGCIPSDNPEEAASEVRRVAKLGLRGADFSPFAASKPVWHPMWEPLWQACEETGLSAQFHIAGGTTSVGMQFGEASATCAYVCVAPMQVDEALASMIWSKALERHPGLKVVLVESGFGWIPYLLERMDYELEDRMHEMGLRMKPSEYWRRQCYATFQKDFVGMRLLDVIGEGNVMWGSDYPHPDGVWPHSQKVLGELFEGVPEGTRRKITRENAVKLYNLA